MTMTAAPAAPIDLAGLKAIPVTLVDPGDNRRGPIGDIADLARSIHALGQLEAVTVTALPGGRFQVFEGHRRHAAIVSLGLPQILAVVRSCAPPAPGLRQVAIHTMRRDFDPIAQAQVLADAMFSGPRPLSREEVAQAIGRSPGWVRDRVSLLQLAPAERARVAAGGLSVAGALEVLRMRRNPSTGGTVARTPARNKALTKAGKPKIREAGREGLQATIAAMCKARGHYLYHPHRSDNSEKGWLDNSILGKHGGFIVRETKGDDGVISPEQQFVMDRLREAGVDADFWTADDLRSGRIDRELRELGRVHRPAR